MNRTKSIEALINKTRKAFDTLKKDYQASLDQKLVSDELKIDIKNIFENLRSCLDYMAHDIFEACISGKQPERLYFPIRQTKREFDIAVDKDFPTLQAMHSEVYNILDSIQPYNDKWLAQFNRLTNDNKHQDLVEQSRTESKRVTVSSKTDGGPVSWGPGVTFGSGVSVIGVPIDPKTQMPMPNNQVKTEVTIWVDFRFKETSESVLPFLETSISSIENVYKQLGGYI